MSLKETLPTLVGSRSVTHWQPYPPIPDPLELLKEIYPALQELFKYEQDKMEHERQIKQILADFCLKMQTLKLKTEERMLYQRALERCIEMAESHEVRVALFRLWLEMLKTPIFEK